MKHWSWSYTYHQEYYPYPYAECFDCAHTPGSLSRESLGTISPELWLHGHLWDWTVGSSIFIADTQSLPSSFNRTQPPFTRDPRPPRASNRKKIAITNSSIKQTPYPPDTHQRAHPRRAERLHPCTPRFPRSPPPPTRLSRAAGALPPLRRASTKYTPPRLNDRLIPGDADGVGVADDMAMQIVAPVLLPQRRDGPRGPWRGGVWGMSLPYTPLENLLLFRGIAKYGLDVPAFASISHALQKNPLIKSGSTYDAGRLGPERLQDLFLHLLGEELRAESEPTARPDGALSPASKKRRLQAPVPSLEYARSHVDKVEAAHQRLQNAYISHALAEISQYEDDYDEVQQEIGELEAAEREEQNRVAREQAEQQSPAVLPQASIQYPPKPPNGVAPAPPAVSPRPPVAPPALSQSHVAPNAIKPAPPAPQRPAPGTQAPSTPVPAPVLVRPQQAAPSPRPGQLPPSGLPASEAGRRPSIQAPVLQLPQGVPSFQQPPLPPPVPVSAAAAAPSPTAPVQHPASDGLRRPEGIARPKQPPTFPPNQPPQGPGQYQWEAYQPNAPPIRQGVGPGQPLAQAPIQPHPHPQHRVVHQQVQQPRPGPQQAVGQLMNQQAMHPQAMGQQMGQQAMNQQAMAQQMSQQAMNQQAMSQQATTPQAMNPPPQKMLVPPGQYSSPMPPGQARPPSNETPGPVPNRPPLLAPNVQPNMQSSPPAQHRYNQSPHQAENQNIPQQPAPSVSAPPRPPPGLVQQRAPPQPLQAPPHYAQHTATAPLPATSPFAQPDPQRAYNSPYQTAPRSAIPDRVQHPRVQHPQMPGTPASAIPARPPANLAPQTPATTFPLRLVTGTITKWGAKSTPSTPLSGPGSYFGSALPESPAYEPLSPVLAHALPPSALARPPVPAAPTAPTASKPPASASPVAPSPAAIAPKPAPTQEQKRPPPTPEPVATTPTPKRKVGRPRNPPKTQDSASPPKPGPSPLAVPPLTNPPVPSPQRPATAASASVEPDAVPQPANGPEPTKIKDEVTTPAPLTETGDTTADESVTGRRQAPRVAKRKREDYTPTPVQTPAENRDAFSEPPAAVKSAEAAPLANEVVWTRGFNRVSGSALEHIIQHRTANMFKAPIREKDAPGYHKVILQPQDLKSIKAAITAGNKAATQQAAALPGGDPNTSSVWLPVSEALQPPKGIINSGQLDRELAHMFSNAIMYNPDPGHGPGPSFLVGENDAQAEGHDGAHHDGTLGYKVDEFGVVKDTRAMFMEVDKLLSELRSAEVRRTGGGRAGAATGTSTRQASVAQRDTSMARDEHNHNAEDDEHTATEVETTTNTAKRRRTTRL